MRACKATVGIISIILFGIGGCGDGTKLTRDKAKDLIHKNINFRVIETSIPEKMVVNSVDRQADEIKTIYYALQNIGMASIRESGRSHFGLSSIEYSADITDTGKKLITRQGKGGHNNQLTVIYLKACEREVTEITGIEQPTEKNAVVQFKYRTTSKTPLADYDAIRLSDFDSFYRKDDCSGETKDGKVDLALFDDGWRVKENQYFK